MPEPFRVHSIVNRKSMCVGVCGRDARCTTVLAPPLVVCNARHTRTRHAHGSHRFMYAYQHRMSVCAWLCLVCCVLRVAVNINVCLLTPNQESPIIQRCMKVCLTLL